MASKTLSAFLAAVAVLTTACTSDQRPDPKDAVKNMFEAMSKSDSVALVANVDLAAAANDLRADIADSTADTSGTQDWGSLLLRQMTGEGIIRRRWLTDNQIVLGRSEVTGDSALVEVSFLDRVTRVQYYNKMRLHFRGDHWVITAFRTM